MDDHFWKENVRTVIDPQKGVCVVACKILSSGEKIGFYEGTVSQVHTMHTVHLDGTIIEGTGVLRNLAHSCAPNAYFRDGSRWLYSFVLIAEGDEVTIDYLSTEPIISAPFECQCGAPNCRRYIGTAINER